MLKLVYEDLNSFVRNQDPKKALNLGYEAKIRNFFKQLDILDKCYDIKEDGEIYFYEDLNLYGENILELPDNLTIDGFLNLNYSSISKLPNNLIIFKSLYLKDTNITELPDSLEIKGPFDMNKITVNSHQTKLINWIENSKFKNRLYIWPII